jgi:murein DD-endopeptidase MepM/ murein hydrolase activator NlpD
MHPIFTKTTPYIFVDSQIECDIILSVNEYPHDLIMALFSHKFPNSRISLNLKLISFTQRDPSREQQENRTRPGTYTRLTQLVPLKLVALIALAISFSIPTVARAGVFSFVAGILNPASTATDAPIQNSQSIDLLQADIQPDPNQSIGGADIAIVDGTALASNQSPLSLQDHDAPQRPGSDQISVYVVRSGDSLSQIADMFNVSVNTIMWTNNLDTKTVHEGQVLVILPVSGVQYVVQKGDTVESIAAAHKGDAGEIRSYNNIQGDGALAVGSTVIIPDGENGKTQAPVLAESSSKPSAQASSSKSPSSSAKTTTSKSSSLPASAIGSQHAVAIQAAAGAAGDTTGYYMRPLKGGVKTQGIHGYNAVDIGTPVGTTIYAAASGDVIVSKDSGWNGGYGNYVVISHPNGTQTLYAHLSSTIVVAGQHVVQGQVLGYSGSTGESTGPHLHFEVRGAVNPF